MVSLSGSSGLIVVYPSESDKEDTEPPSDVSTGGLDTGLCGDIGDDQKPESIYYLEVVSFRWIACCLKKSS